MLQSKNVDYKYRFVIYIPGDIMKMVIVAFQCCRL